MNLFFQKKMNKNIFILLAISLLFSLSSCNREKVIAEQRYEFPNANWDFEQRIITLECDIEATEEPCKIVVETEHDNISEPRALPVTFCITSPDGAETVKRMGLIFDGEHDVNENLISSVAYKEKYFNTSGKYQFELYRTYEKYDLHGIRAVTVKVIKLKKDKE